MVRLFAVLVSVFLLSACATATEKPMQDLKVELVGTGEALCDITQPGRRYRVYAPSTVRIVKSSDPIHVKCNAPANRVLEQDLEPVVTDAIMANVTNGVAPGLLWDHFTGAMYKYPDKVVMDFSNIEPRDYPLPDYQMVIDRNPYIQGMEMFRPGKAALLSDIGQRTQQMPRRVSPASDEADVISTTPAKSSAPVLNPDVSDSENK